jgi:hypothetical protein
MFEEQGGTVEEWGQLVSLTSAAVSIVNLVDGRPLLLVTGYLLSHEDSEWPEFVGIEAHVRGRAETTISDVKVQWGYMYESSQVKSGKSDLTLVEGPAFPVTVRPNQPRTKWLARIAFNSDVMQAFKDLRKGGSLDLAVLAGSRERTKNSRIKLGVDEHRHVEDKYVIERFGLID